MANLSESADFTANIYRIDQDDPVLGWDGTNLNIANLQAKALADRTQWLKTRVDLGARFTGINAPAITTNNQVVTATPDDLKGALVRLNTTNGPACSYELPDANTAGDGSNVTISHEINATIPYASSGNFAVRVKAATGQNVVDLSTGATANELVVNPNTFVRVFKISNSLWGMMILNSEAENPAGAVTAWAANTPPFGWLPCEGQAISRATYARLFANIGTTFGTGNGSTTFNIPDLRGEFIRGWANARSVDTGRAFGSAQQGTIHAIDSTGVNQLYSAVMTSVALTPGNAATVAARTGLDYDANGATNYPNSTSVYANGDGSGGFDYGVARPRNVALMYIIKF
jgi:microcystin-dependent protein